MASRPKRRGSTDRKRTSQAVRPRSGRGKARSGFVGRDASPVRDSYPEKAARPTPTSRPSPIPPAGRPAHPPDTSPSATPGPTGLPAAAPPEGLIRLERPFDPDEVSRLLGETSIRVTVPRDALAEVLRRVTEFMGFGIYVYSISVRPAPSEMLRGFVVELQRVDFDPAAREWRPFVERGAVGAGSDAPP